jgi:hypothetical protein
MLALEFFPRRRVLPLFCPAAIFRPGTFEEREFTITARPAPNEPLAHLKVRKNIDSRGAEELAGLCRDIKQVLDPNDKRVLIIGPAGLACRWAGASITTRFAWSDRAGVP